MLLEINEVTLFIITALGCAVAVIITALGCAATIIVTILKGRQDK